MKNSTLQHILKEHHSSAYIWARQCCSFDEDMAKDVLQLVYLKILEGKAVYHEKSSLKTWLFSVIKFTAAEFKRKEQVTIGLDDLIEYAQTAEEEQQGFHEAMIMLLPKRQQEVLLLVFYHSLTLEKAAVVMGISIGSVRTHYDRGKKNLRELIIKNNRHENA
ncbi:RNA polymerase sigma factor [Anditalea andensis]|uniref:RNA polymerase n=1 Tax=Anditalea andensis TaxID=1048983 RepID=A0A074KU28_9BACT|nr:RNA polymerase sigma factor [Anditalea andensis]KEO71765.1 RNA polymerase [Anditalea andensis]